MNTHLKKKKKKKRWILCSLNSFQGIGVLNKSRLVRIWKSFSAIIDHDVLCDIKLFGNLLSQLNWLRTLTPFHR